MARVSKARLEHCSMVAGKWKMELSTYYRDTFGFVHILTATWKDKFISNTGLPRFLDPDVPFTKKHIFLTNSHFHILTFYKWNKVCIIYENIFKSTSQSRTLSMYWKYKELPFSLAAWHTQAFINLSIHCIRRLSELSLPIPLWLITGKSYAVRVRCDSSKPCQTTACWVWDVGVDPDLLAVHTLGIFVPLWLSVSCFSMGK